MARAEVLATHNIGSVGLPTYSLNPSTLSQNWQTDYPTALGMWPYQVVACGDFNSDGNTELVIPYSAANGNPQPNQVFSGVNGKRLYALPQTSSSYSVYRDPRNSVGAS